MTSSLQYSILIIRCFFIVMYAESSSPSYEFEQKWGRWVKIFEHISNLPGGSAMVKMNWKAVTILSMIYFQTHCAICGWSLDQLPYMESRGLRRLRRHAPSLIGPTEGDITAADSAWSGWDVPQSCAMYHECTKVQLKTLFNIVKARF